MHKELYVSCGWGDIFCLGTKAPLVASGAVTALLPRGLRQGLQWATVCAEGSKAHVVSKLSCCSSWQGKWTKCHPGLSVNPVRGFFSCPWSPSQFGYWISRGEPICLYRITVRRGFDGKGPSALARVYSSAILPVLRINRKPSLSYHSITMFVFRLHCLTIQRELLFC